MADLIGLIQAGLSFFYIALLVNAVLGSVKDAIKHQRLIQGKLIFFIYSLFVYYGNFKINILFWSVFVDEPIKQAYGTINFLTTKLLGLSIENQPMFIFKYLLPAVFVYYFVNYWISYAFMDKRLSKMISIAALVILFRGNMTMGLISWSTIPFGIPLFGPAWRCSS